MSRLSVCLLVATTASVLIGCRPKPAPPAPLQQQPVAAAPTIAPELLKSTPPAPNVASVAERSSKGVIGVSVFDTSGKLVTHGSGFFVSEDGKFVTDASVVASGANAVVKTPGKKIYNVTGFLARPDARNLVLLKAEAHDVPFVAANSAVLPAVGGKVTVVSSSSVKEWQTPVHGTIATRSNDTAGDFYEIAPPVQKARSGSLVIDDRGEIVGLITSRGENSDATIVRPLSAVKSLIAGSPSGVVASWQSATPSPTPSPTASPTSTPSASPKPSPSPARRSKLVYNPPPIYPTAARRARFIIKGAGSYRILFAPDGHASSVQIQRSAGSDILDNAAISGLSVWRAEPGPSWSITVPITFQP